MTYISRKIAMSHNILIEIIVRIDAATRNLQVTRIV